MQTSTDVRHVNVWATNSHLICMPRAENEVQAIERRRDTIHGQITRSRSVAFCYGNFGNPLERAIVAQSAAQQFPFIPSTHKSRLLAIRAHRFNEPGSEILSTSKQYRPNAKL